MIQAIYGVTQLPGGIADKILKMSTEEPLNDIKKLIILTQKEKDDSYKRVKYTLQMFDIILSNNLDLIYPNYRKSLIQKLKNISNNDFNDYKEYKDIFDENYQDIDDVRPGWRYNN